MRKVLYLFGYIKNASIIKPLNKKIEYHHPYYDRFSITPKLSSI